MNRRQFLKFSLSSTAIVGGLGSGAYWLSTPANTYPLSIESVLSSLRELKVSSVQSLGAWSPYKILVHCAQSVEYSITGYPIHKSDLFKETLGTVAFSVFSSKGVMQHNLSEDIPGADSIELEGKIEHAFKRFESALLAFQAHKGALKPHFAYGELTKSEYELAHAMHFYNHLDELVYPSKG